MDSALVARWRMVCLVTLGAFLGLSVAVYATGLLPGDQFLREEIIHGRGTMAHAVGRWANLGGKWVVLAPAMLLLFAVSPATRRRWWLWCTVFIAAGSLEQLFKFLVARPRPLDYHSGFPSGHVTAAATFAVILIYALSRERMSPAARAGLLVLAVALVGAVGFARVILNAHWPSDVLGGVLLGTGCAAAAAWWDTAHPNSTAERQPEGAPALPKTIG
jgi:undecaprenyl-diphosphatase